MKIISQPPNENWSHKHTCLHCDAVLEVEKSDIKRQGTTRYFAACPICNRDFDIPPTNIPKLVKLNAPDVSSNLASWLDR